MTHTPGVARARVARRRHPLHDLALVGVDPRVPHRHDIDVDVEAVRLRREARRVAKGRARVRSRPRAGRSVVVADTTGVGLPVFEMLGAAGVTGLKGVTIHSGDAVTRDGPISRVPKRDLVSTLQVLFQSGRLQIADGLPEGRVLRHELQSFKAKINIATGHDSYEAWREGDHDDLVLSLAMAAWYAETHPPVDWAGAGSFTSAF